MGLGLDSGNGAHALVCALIVCLAGPSALRFVQIVKQLHFVWHKSTFVVVLTAGFTGMVLALQGYYTSENSVRRFWLCSRLEHDPGVRPVLAALMVTARAGSAMTAEIGIMRITDQIDALDTMAINPLQYLIAPKLVAGLIGVPLLVAIFDVVGIYGGYLVGVELLGGNGGAYWNSIESAVEWKDVWRYSQVDQFRAHCELGLLL